MQFRAILGHGLLMIGAQPATVTCVVQINTYMSSLVIWNFSGDEKDERTSSNFSVLKGGHPGYDARYYFLVQSSRNQSIVSCCIGLLY